MGGIFKECQTKGIKEEYLLLCVIDLMSPSDVQDDSPQGKLPVTTPGAARGQTNDKRTDAGHRSLV